MAQLHVNVNKLNVRKSPVKDFADKGNVVGVLHEGTVFNSVRTIENELGVWHGNEDGHWVWEKGANPAAKPSQEVVFNDYTNLPFIPERMSWAHEFLGIPFVWNDIQTAGRNVVVGIIDTGIDTGHDDLKSVVLGNSIHVDNNGIKDDSSPFEQRVKDEFGHGTEMAGIIAGIGKTVYGMAPECRLLVVKLDGVFGRTAISIAAGINFLVNEKVDLISISQTAPDSPVLKTAVVASVNAGIPVFASIGDNHVVGGPKTDRDSFPACYNESIAVGSFGKDGKVCDFSQRNDHLCFLAPGDENNLLTTALNNKTTLSAGATSIAAAIAAGCFALIVSFLKTKGRIDLKSEALTRLQKTCDDTGDVIGKDPDNGFGRINLRNTLSQIKSLV